MILYLQVIDEIKLIHLMNQCNIELAPPGSLSHHRIVKHSNLTSMSSTDYPENADYLYVNHGDQRVFFNLKSS